MTGYGQRFCEFLRRQSQSRPENIAYRFLDSGLDVIAAVSYAELERQSIGIASKLLQANLSGSRIALLQNTSANFVGSLFAIFQSGAVAAPLRPPSRGSLRRRDGASERMTRILLDAQISAILTTPDHLDALRTSAELQIDQAYSVVAIADDLVLLTKLQDRAAPPPSSDAILQYTSGSTAFPRGVRVTHENIAANAALISSVLNVGPQSVALHWLPLHHDMGMMGGVLAPMFAGCESTLIYPSAFAARPALWVEAMSRLGATITTAPNFAYQACVDAVPVEQVAQLDLSRWRTAVCGAEPIRIATLETFAKHFEPAGFAPITFVPSYGLAEATLFVAGGHRESGPKSRDVDDLFMSTDSAIRAPVVGKATKTLVSCGPIHPEQDIAIVGADGARCKPGVVGEIWIRGPSVCRGYVGGSMADQEMFGAATADGEGGFLRTGDLGVVQDGEFYVVGRLKDMILVRGVNHYPQDIELTAEESHTALVPNAAAAFTIPHDGEERLVIVQEIYRRQESLSREAAKSVQRAVAIRHGVAPHQMLIIRQGGLPRTTSGKVQRHAVRALLMEDRLARLNITAEPQPRPARGAIATPTEATVLRIWERILDKGEIDLESNFFDLGGDSMLLTGVHAELLQAFSREFEIMVLVEHPTVRAQAAYFDRGSHREPELSAALSGGEQRAGSRLGRLSSRQSRRLGARHLREGA
jgi:acyl-CoA synthetase (AMP-forming)/AMP-acid ligase II